MTLGIIFALICAISVAAGNIFLKKAIKNFSSYSEFLVFSLFCLILWPLSAIFIPFNADKFYEGLVFGALSGLFAQGYYIYVISKGELIITSTLTATAPIFTVFFAMIFSREYLTLFGVAALALIIIGTLVVALPDADKKLKKKLSFVLILLPISSALGIGVTDALSNNFIDRAGASTFLIATAIVQLPIALVLMLINKEKLSDLKKVFTHINEYQNALIGAVFLSLGTLAIFLAFEYGAASIVSPIAGTAPAFTVIMAFLVLKEKISRKNILGIVLILTGIFVLSF